MLKYVVRGLDPAPFQPLFGLDEETLANRLARRFVVDDAPGYPDRIELRDCEPGERVLLVNYTHLDLATPYRASHAVYVREGATNAALVRGELPDALRIRVLSLRAFDEAGMMRDADVVSGVAAEPVIERLLADPQTAFVHAHFAKRGCFAARIDPLR